MQGERVGGDKLFETVVKKCIELLLCIGVLLLAADGEQKEEKGQDQEVKTR